MSEASRYKTHKTNILRPVFGRLLPEWLKSPRVTDGKCEVVRLEVKAESHDTQPVSTSIASCKSDIAVFESRQAELACSLKDCRNRIESISERLQCAAELRKVAAARLDSAGEPNKAGSAIPGLLNDSYLNFKMRTNVLNEKHERFLQEFDRLDQQHRQASLQLESQMARLHDLKAVGEDDHSVRRAA